MGFSFLLLHAGVISRDIDGRLRSAAHPNPHPPPYPAFSRGLSVKPVSIYPIPLSIFQLNSPTHYQLKMTTTPFMIAFDV